MISRRGRYQSWSSTGELETSLGFPSRLLRKLGLIFSFLLHGAHGAIPRHFLEVLVDP